MSHRAAVLICAASLATTSCGRREPAPRAAAGPEVKVILVGDIMLSRGVAGKIRDSGNPRLPFEGMSEFLKSADFNFGNLESPVSGSEQFPARGSLVFNAPESNVAGLLQHRFRVLSLANNHALDQGKAGLAHTREYLASNGIETVGPGGDLDEAWQARIVEAHGRKIGFLAASYCSYNDGGRATNDYVARIEDLGRLRSALASLKRRCASIVVSMHAGDEYVLHPNDAQVRFAHAAIDAGADVVVGSHPHCVQPVEWYKGGLIFYSLGNFIFDQKPPETRQGLAVKLAFGRSGRVLARLYPVRIERYCCAELADAAEAQAVLARAGVSSAVLLRPPAGPRE